MKKIALLNLTRIIFSVLAGTIAFAVWAIEDWNDPPGDEPSRIKGAKETLEQFRQRTVSNTTDRIEQGMKLEYNDPVSWRVLKITLDDGQIRHVTPEIPPSPEEVATTRYRLILAEALQKAFAQEQWKHFEEVSRRLTRNNQNIMEAKALSYLSEKPEHYYGFEWDNRFQDAGRSFRVCTNAQRIWGSLDAGALPFLIVTSACWLALLILAWLWYFLLDRLSEVSRAVRGKQGDDETKSER